MVKYKEVVVLITLSSPDFLNTEVTIHYTATISSPDRESGRVAILRTYCTNTQLQLASHPKSCLAESVVMVGVKRYRRIDLQEEDG